MKVEFYPGQSTVKVPADLEKFADLNNLRLVIFENPEWNRQWAQRRRLGDELTIQVPDLNVASGASTFSFMTLSGLVAKSTNEKESC